jgi:hypothetical protein
MSNILEKIAPGNHNDIKGYAGEVLLACYNDNSEWCLYMTDKNLFVTSDFCKKNSIVLTREQLGKFNGENFTLPKEALVVVIPEYKELLLIEHIITIQQFMDFMKFVDKYLLNLAYIESNLNYNIWLSLLKDKQKQVWIDNEILLSNVDQFRFAKPKFPTAPTQQGQPGAPTPYPTAAPKNPPKNIKLRPIKVEALITKEELYELIVLLNQMGAQNYIDKLIAILTSSLEYCDLVLANGPLLKFIQSSKVLHSALYYGLRVLYLEEVSRFTDSKYGDRHVLNIEAMQHYPVVNSGSIVSSPYCIPVINGNVGVQALSAPCYIEGKRGVYTLREFQNRLDAFTGGALKYVNWGAKGVQSALCGSTMVAALCINPLELLFDNCECYWEEFWPSKKSIVQPEKVTKKAISYYEEEDDNGDGNITEKEDDEDASPLPDIDIAVETEDPQTFDEVALEHFERIKQAAAENGIKGLSLERIETENKYKYKIYGLHRDIDIFYVNSVPGLISKFHLGIVRFWYDGKTVWGYPSGVCAAFLGMNIDIRWVSCNKDLRDIVLKYFQRGYGTFINLADRNNLVDYINNSSVWPHIEVDYSGNNNWRRRRAQMRALTTLYRSQPAIFNPSNGRHGIHHGLKTRRNFMLNRKQNIKLAPVRNPRANSAKNNYVLMPHQTKELAAYL